jgi:hypothetical protein
MFKRMHQLGMPSTSINTSEQLYGVTTTNNSTPYGPTPSIEFDRGTPQGDTLSPFLFTLFFKHVRRWRIVCSRGYRPGAPTANADPNETRTTYTGHGFADGLSFATESATNMFL